MCQVNLNLLDFLLVVESLQKCLHGRKEELSVNRVDALVSLRAESALDRDHLGELAGKEKRTEKNALRSTSTRTPFAKSCV